jgi:4-carboxymuconolactone decarboxylase
MTPGDAAGLDSRTAALVRVAAAVARGREAELRERLAAARAAGVPALWIEELLLQSTLVVGYPLALVAFAAWRTVAGPAGAAGAAGAGGAGGAAGAGGGGDSGDAGGAERLAHADWRRWAERGPAVCRAVYGRAYHKLLLALRALHPALEPLVLVDAYGKLIGRPGLDLKRRELATVAAIAVLGAPEQLHSHLRGALNTGASAAEVEATLALVDGDLDAERRAAARAQWADVERRRA